MPRLTRWFIKTALCYLVLVAGLGTVFVLMRGTGRSYPPELAIVHTHLGLIGFILNMVVGVAYWMFPRVRDRHPDTKGRYNPLLAWSSYAGINGGLLLRVISEPFAWQEPGGAWSVAYIGSAALLLAGVVLFVTNVWPRIREIVPPK